MPDDNGPDDKAMPNGVVREPTTPGQRSVWDFPRPAEVLKAPHKIAVFYGGDCLIETSSAYMVVETSHPPTYYLPHGDLRWPKAIRASGRQSVCEWKGVAHYFDLEHGGQKAANAVWCYPSPEAGFAEIRGYLAFYPSLMAACYVDDERVRPQPGHFYGGWVTSHYTGPFKGVPGSRFW